MLNDEPKVQFVVSESLTRIVSLKKRLDYLMFIFLTTIVFAINFKKDFKDTSFFMGLVIKDDVYYHIVIAIILTILFTIIGSHLIEYCMKRSRLDKLFQDKGYFETDYEISRTIIPTSFYEFMYSQYYHRVYSESEDVKKDKLRILSSYILLFSFFLSHFLSVLHLYIGIENKLLALVSICFILGIDILCYVEFIKSLGKAKKELGEIILKRIIEVLIPSLIILLIFLFFFFNV